jgi:adenine-specific DNA-methyltransferase
MNSLATTTQPEITTEGLLDYVDAQRILAFESNIENEVRGSLGQFFTPTKLAGFMAGFFDTLPKEVSLLDPGAGCGSLCAAFALHALQQNPPIRCLRITAWEIHPAFIPLLHNTLGMIGDLCRQHKVEFEAHVQEGDFLANLPPALEYGPLFSEGLERYDCVFMNPPYKKIHSASPHRQILSKLGLETVNLYTAFLWLAAKDLKPGGQLVSINPRSFANGPYYTPFRKAFLDEMTLRRVHLFDSRNKTFKDDSVLQENVILHAVKSRLATPTTITSSDHVDDLIKERQVAQQDFIDSDNPEQFIHLVADEKGAWIRRQMGHFQSTLEEIGVNVSTGRVVDFRAKAFLKTEESPDSIPLIYPGHFKGGAIVWPRADFKKSNYFQRCPESESQLVQAGNYVLVKRFTAKEEKRRVVSAVLSPKEVQAPAYAIENHLNYFHQHQCGIAESLARGLSAFLNSTLFDEYFRQFNGHTQVNATDLRNMRYPSREALIAFGKKIGTERHTQEDLDDLIYKHLLPMAESKHNPVKAKKKIEQSLNILKQIDVPRAQQNERSALTLLALLDLKPGTPWKNAQAVSIGITEMMDWFRDHYGVTYAPNTRETVRRQTIHQFVEMGIAMPNPDQPDRATNSPKFHYRIEPSALELLQQYGKREWKQALFTYSENVDSLRVLHNREREMNRIEVRLPDGRKKSLSAGGQNVLIQSIIKDFCSRYTPGGYVCYLGDAGEKMTDEERDYLESLGVTINTHGKMPDVVIHLKDKNWLILVEAVTSHGPIDNKRKRELEKLFTGASTDLVFITAFSTRKVMVKYLHDIAWETDVWLAENPSHLIHFNGEKFLGPYNP